MEQVFGTRSGSAYGDGWVRSACTIRLNRCGIPAHVDEDEVVDKILGDPEQPHNHGRTWAKGDSEQPDLFGASPFSPIMINFQSNMMKPSVPPDIVGRLIKPIPFVACIARRFEETRSDHAK